MVCLGREHLLFEAFFFMFIILIIDSFILFLPPLCTLKISFFFSCNIADYIPLSTLPPYSQMIMEKFDKSG